jgi:hypothetical protein
MHAYLIHELRCERHPEFDRHHRYPSFHVFICFIEMVHCGFSCCKVAGGFELMHVFIYLCMYVCTYVCMYCVCVCMYVCMYVCTKSLLLMSWHMYVYMYEYTCVCMHMSTVAFLAAKSLEVLSWCTYVCMYVCIYVCSTAAFLAAMYVFIEMVHCGFSYCKVAGGFELVHQYVLMYACMYVCMYVHAHVCMCIYAQVACLSGCEDAARMYVYMYMYMYVCVFMHKLLAFLAARSGCCA